MWLKLRDTNKQTVKQNGGNKMFYNEEVITIQLTRKQLNDLRLACTAAKQLSNDNGKKWDTLHKYLVDVSENEK